MSRKVVRLAAQASYELQLRLGRLRATPTLSGATKALALLAYPTTQARHVRRHGSPLLINAWEPRLTPHTTHYILVLSVQAADCYLVDNVRAYVHSSIEASDKGSDQLLGRAIERKAQRAVTRSTLCVSWYRFCVVGLGLLVI